MSNYSLDFPSHGQMANSNRNRIVLSYTFNLCNPNNIFSSEQLLREWPEEFDHPVYIPEFPRPNIYSCSHSDYFLPQLSTIHNKPYYIRLPSCTSSLSDFIDVVDVSCRCRVPSSDSSLINSFLNLVIEEYSLKQFNRSFDYYLDETALEFLDDSVFSHINTSKISHIRYEDIPVELMCHCNASFEPTSGIGKIIQGTAASIYSAYSFLTYSQSEKDIKDFIETWVLDIVNLGINFNISTMVITFLKFFKHFMSISDFIYNLVNIFTKLFNNMCSYLGKTASDFLDRTKTRFSPFSQQPPLEAEIELLTELDSGRVTVTSGTLENLPFLEPIFQYVAEKPVIATLMSSFVVISGGIILGNLSCGNDSRISPGDKIAKSFFNLSKVEKGTTSAILMIKNFNNLLSEYIMTSLGLHTNSALLQALDSVDIPDEEDCIKSELFEYIKYLTDPNHKAELATSKLLHKRLNFCIAIIDQIHHKVANSEIHLAMPSLNYLLSKVIELKKARLFVVKYAPEDAYRFTPFWLNIAGTAGTGKSAFVPLLVSSVLTILRKKGGFDLPDQDSWTYPVNFTDKFLTKYAGQYCVTIDDFLQDTAPLGDRSSALDVISWVSCIPHYTNQADLESKGTPFTSKMLVSTTNDLSMSNRKEIISVDALRRRVKVQVRLVLDDKAPKDPHLLPGVRIELWDLLKNFKIRDITSVELIAHCVNEYIKHYRHEITLAESRQPSEQLLKEVESLVVTSGRMSWCSFGFKPSLKPQRLLSSLETMDIHIYNCDCEYHKGINDKYIDHCFTLFDSTDTVDLDIYGFERSQKRVQDEISLYEKTKIEVLEIYESIKSSFNASLIFKAFAAAAGALAVYTTYKYLTAASNDDDLSSPSLEASAAQYDKGKPSRAGKKTAHVNFKNFKGYVSTDVVATNGIGEYYRIHEADEQANQLIKNTAINGSVVRLLNLRNRLVNTGIMIRGSFMLSNHHYFSEFQEGDEFVVYTNSLNNEAVVNQTYTKSRLIRVDDLDAAIYQFDTSVLSRYKSIVKHFLSDNEIPTTDVRAVVMTALPHFQTIVNLNAKPLTCNVPYQNSSKTENYRLLKSFVINHQVEFGQSGSLLIGLNKQQSRKFLGIQTCRDSATHLGYFVPITESMLLATLAKFNDKLNYEVKIDEAVAATCGKVDTRCPPNLSHNSLQYIGTVGKTRYVKPQLKTKIIPSLIQDPESLTQLPSVLSDFDTRMKESLQGSPVIYRAVQGFDSQIGTLDRNILMKAVDELAMDYNFSMYHESVQRKVLSNFETINGIPGLIKRIEMNSSPGWPYAVERRDTTKGGKSEWFTQMDTPPEGYSLAYTMKPKLMSGLKRRENLAKEGLNDLTVAYVCLKDETRPLAKIEEGKTRAFICLPMDYNLLVKKYFGAFTATQHLLAGKIASCVGIDPATQWKVLFDRLNEKNVLWEDFDYQNWDQHLHPELVYQVARIVNKWYGDDDNSENGLVRRVLLLDLIHTILIVKDRLFIKSTGQCSGCAITAELNCIVHELLMYYVWIKLHQDAGLTTDINEFRQEVAMALYGDDILLAVDNPRISFNGLTIKPIMEKLGMGITPGNKLSTEFKVKKPSELEFLKRSFKVDGNHVKAPLRSEVINNIYQWIHKSDDFSEATKVNCEAALQESYMHSIEYFDKLLNEMNSRIASYNRDNLIPMNYIVRRYADYDEKYRKSEFLCLGLAETSVRPVSYD